MDTAKTIKELRESTGMSRKEFSEHTGIPVRTLEDWEAGRRTPPEYIPRLLAYQLKYEDFSLIKEKSNDKVSIITDPDGKKVVLINDIRFKSRRSIDWDEIEQILRKYIGKYYEIAETAEKVYIGSDFPDEFTHSKYTKAMKGANEKAKANAITAIGELIQIADNKAESPDYDRRHGNKAKNGWYRYDTRFGIPIYSELGEIDRYNVFRARMLVRCDEKNKLYLYDIVQIKKETSTPLE
ncbi:MAG: helix-turn-helix domain-containing protein [Lachnospiraceae bacterium]|nr:helix-turn-helix domain-containing protein [Lachnospiraceae bacterium]